MSKKLMIIESPNKIKTIAHYLKDQDFELLATYGHLRDLSKFGMGFSKDLEPKWVLVDRNIKTKNKDQADNKSILEQIHAAAARADEIYLSTDPDREGEAIAWHVWSLLSDQDKKKCFRVVFNEITARAINESLNHARDIDLNQVNSYLARRILDRNFGYKLSSFVRKFLGGISAGRVQSVALKFLKIREDEINSFVPESWFTIKAFLKNGLILDLRKISSDLTNYQLNDSVNDGKVNFTTIQDAQKILDYLSPNYTFVCEHPPKKEQNKPKSALKTATMQQEAISRFKLSSKTIEATAQKLYEGVEINGQTISLITYPRTDRDDLSDTFISDAERYIKDHYGIEYWSGVKKKKTSTNDQTKTNLVQGAHEAIRPSDLSYPPEVVKPYLDKVKYQLYCLVWVRALGSLMTNSVYQYRYYDFENKGCLFNNYSRSLVFDGYEKIYQQYHLWKTNDQNNQINNLAQLAKLKLNENYLVKDTKIEQHDKNPPARYNEATLIRALEKEGIGRPSTYVTIANTVLKREYANKKNLALVPTEVGMKIVANLQKIFPDIISFDYTRKMEEGLDEIAENKVNWKDFLKVIFAKFEKTLYEANQSQPLPEVEYVNRKCPECQHELIYRRSFRKSRISRFIGCSDFPKCKFSEPISKPILLDETCPDCQQPLVKRTSRYGSTFFGCSSFPKCRFIKEDPDNPKPRKNNFKNQTKTEK
ncbi:DNA topoisomerase I [[Mycoplasma] cavipharyngis]|uniref:type I DNA topoisomerase n=1 Tax=[Mycoplasma] cavipharyngis TaxID=92757 RepID=UPI0037049281